MICAASISAIKKIRTRIEIFPNDSGTLLKESEILLIQTKKFQMGLHEP